MEKRIELEKRGRPARLITELNLDNCRSTNIVGLTDDFTALEALSLINVGLTTLKGFPKLPNLTRLELSDNRISSGLSNLVSSPKLTHLNISGNKIKDLEELKALENFKSLQVLDLFNNDATSIDNYREKIFALIPSLKYLDGFDANEEEALSDGDDDDELNGNESEGEDGAEVFCINGMEIDLTELNEFEAKLKAKRKLATENEKSNEANNIATSSSTAEVGGKQNDDAIDELDEYLNQLAIDIQLRDNSQTKVAAATASIVTKPLLTVDAAVDEPTAAVQAVDQGVVAIPAAAAAGQPKSTVPFGVLLYWFMGIVFFVNTVKRTSLSDEMGDDDDDDDDDGDEEEDDDDEEDGCGDVSLAEVYNDDLEEDNSDYVEGEGDDGEGEEEEEDVDSDELDESGAGAPAAANNQAPADQPAEEESPARGKKRKHDG